jgi:hypothetical protein
MPKCDYVTPEKGHYTYCESESVYALNGVNYCAKHEPYPPGDYPAESTEWENAEALAYARRNGDISD